MENHPLLKALFAALFRTVTDDQGNINPDRLLVIIRAFWTFFGGHPPAPADSPK